MTTVPPIGDSSVRLLSEGANLISCPALSRHLLLERNARLQDLVFSDKFQGTLSHTLTKELAKTQAILDDDLSCKSCGTILSDGKTSKWIVRERGPQPSSSAKSRKSLKKTASTTQERYTRLECPVCRAFLKRPLTEALSMANVTQTQSQIVTSYPATSIDTSANRVSATAGTTSPSKPQFLSMTPIAKAPASKNRKQALKKSSLQAMLAKSEQPKAGLGAFDLSSFMKKS